MTPKKQEADETGEIHYEWKANDTTYAITVGMQGQQSGDFTLTVR